METVDSLVAAEFAKDGIGSLTVGVISGWQLAWTRSVGFADMKTHRLSNRNTVYRIGSITKPSGMAGASRDIAHRCTTTA